MIVGFTAPVHGQPGTTSNMIATGTMLALDRSVKILMAHTHTEMSTLERAYAKLLDSILTNEINGGMDEIQRLVECSMLTPETLRDNALSIIKDRLDIINGAAEPNVQTLKKTLGYVLDMYRRSYDLLFVDISSGTKNELSKLIMERADLIVVNLNQNTMVLDSYFNNEDWKQLVDKKNVVYCLGSYDRTSKYTIERISRNYKLPAKKIGAIPYNVRFRDASNEQNVIDYLLRARTVEKKWLEFDEEYYFTECTRNMGNIILNSLDLVPLLEEEMYA